MGSEMCIRDSTTSVNPTTYYTLQEGHFFNAPTDGIVVLVTNAILLMTCGTLHVVGKWYLNYEQSKLNQHYVYDERRTSMRIRRRSTWIVDQLERLLVNNNHSNALEFPPPYMLVGPTLMYLMNSLIFSVGIMSLYYVPVRLAGGASFWTLITLFVGNQGIILPIVVAIRYENVRLYAVRRIRPIMETVFNCIDLLALLMRNLKRGTTISPAT